MNLKILEATYKVVKLEDNGHIRVDIYNTESSALVKSFSIKHHTNAAYNADNIMSQLFALDIDQDNQPEIIVPALNHQLIASLNVIKYNQQMKAFTIDSINK